MIAVVAQSGRWKENVIKWVSLSPPVEFVWVLTMIASKNTTQIETTLQFELIGCSCGWCFSPDASAVIKRERCSDWPALFTTVPINVTEPATGFFPNNSHFTLFCPFLVSGVFCKSLSVYLINNSRGAKPKTFLHFDKQQNADVLQGGKTENFHDKTTHTISWFSTWIKLNFFFAACLRSSAGEALPRHNQASLRFLRVARQRAKEASKCFPIVLREKNKKKTQGVQLKSS